MEIGHTVTLLLLLLHLPISYTYPIFAQCDYLWDRGPKIGTLLLRSLEWKFESTPFIGRLTKEDLLLGTLSSVRRILKLACTHYSFSYPKYAQNLQFLAKQKSANFGSWLRPLFCHPDYYWIVSFNNVHSKPKDISWFFFGGGALSRHKLKRHPNYRVVVQLFSNWATKSCQICYFLWKRESTLSFHGKSPFVILTVAALSIAHTVHWFNSHYQDI